MKTYNNTRGFSLIELLVALSILAVVAAVIVPRFLNVRTQAAQTATQSQQRTLQRAFSQFLSLGGTAPAASATNTGLLLTALSTPASGNPPARTLPAGWTDSGGNFGSSTISLSLGTVGTAKPALTANAGYAIDATGAAWYCDGAGTVYSITYAVNPGTVTFSAAAADSATGAAVTVN